MSGTKNSAYFWNEYLKNFDKQLETQCGFVNNEVDSVYSWAWTSPAMSVVEDTDGSINTIILPDKQFEVFFDDNGLWIPFGYVNQKRFDYEKLYMYEYMLED